MTPWDLWSRAIDSGIAGARTGWRMAELMQASQQVIAARVTALAAAVRDPVNGDYHEFARMVPEKIDAFGSAAASTAADLHAIQADAAANWQQVAAMAMQGRPPTFAEVAALNARAVRMAERALGAGGKAMRPVHATATGNARRLNKAR